jgi:diguanylate cyclase (GGDEF)-like protein/PAS domain S-box-containing protein
VVTLRDITKRLQASAELERAQTRFRLAFQSAPTGMALSAAGDGTLLDVNETLAEMLGTSREALVGRSIRDITHPDDWAANSTQLDHARDGAVSGYKLDKRYIRADGQIVWARTSVSVMAEQSASPLVIAHVEDITEQRRAAEHLQWAASHDELTGLPNRAHFLDQLRRRLDGAEVGSIAVLFIDLDNFKVVNDSLGHAVGDQLLRGMSERLRSVVRDRDMLGRFGGDEFIVMLDGLQLEASPADVAERIRVAVSHPLVVEGSELYVSGSIGIAFADRAGVTADELLRDADAAMYRAKARGRDCVECFAPGTHETSVLALRTSGELRHGLERGEIVPYYQPIVDLASGQLTGFEVLARWRHPDRGLLGPDQFLAMAEETGLIAEVGAAVLRASLAQLGLWQANVPSLADVSIAVNVSVRQLVDSRFHDVVAEALAESGVRAESLWLEITETALMSDVKSATIALRNLRNLGLHLSVDDFGTGYSSLTYLKRFPVEAIKVDRGFVKGLGIDAEDTTIVEAVVNLGRSLGLMVVAEGVETPLQLTRLREMGCDRAQGYLFGRPRPAALIEAERAQV